eukprot:834758-Pelagomonas_calceolata.AAC.1
MYTDPRAVGCLHLKSTRPVCWAAMALHMWDASLIEQRGEKDGDEARVVSYLYGSAWCRMLRFNSCRHISESAA